MADARGIQDSQRAITLGTPFLGIQRAIGGATQRPIWLQSESGPRKTSRK
jgi:hypothetical protein